MENHVVESDDWGFQGWQLLGLELLTSGTGLAHRPGTFRIGGTAVFRIAAMPLHTRDESTFNRSRLAAASFRACRDLRTRPS